MFLSFAPFLDVPALAAGSTDRSPQLTSVQNKRVLTIDYINRRFASIKGFYAKGASFEENKPIFEGTLSERIATANRKIRRRLTQLL